MAVPPVWRNFRSGKHTHTVERTLGCCTARKTKRQIYHISTSETVISQQSSFIVKNKKQFATTQRDFSSNVSAN